MARPGRGRSEGAQRSSGSQRRRPPARTAKGIISVLADVANEVDRAVKRPPTAGVARTKFQVVALLVREERARLTADDTLSAARRSDELKRLDGVATMLARTAVRDTTLLELLADDVRVSDSAFAFKASLMRTTRTAL